MEDRTKILIKSHKCIDLKKKYYIICVSLTTIDFFSLSNNNLRRSGFASDAAERLTYILFFKQAALSVKFENDLLLNLSQKSTRYRVKVYCIKLGPFLLVNEEIVPSEWY